MRDDFKALYVSRATIKQISIKHMQAIQIYRDKNKITALTMIDGKQHLASFGCENG